MSAEKSEVEPASVRIVRPVRPGRNDDCHCGSGKKYKKCHLAADEAEDRKLHQEEAARLAAAAETSAESSDAAPEKPAHVKPARSDTAAYQPAKKVPGKSMFQRKVGGS